MNANKLADEIDGFLKEQEQLPWGTKQVYLDQAATMLRQQAKEIIELECEKERQREKYEGVLCDRDVEIEVLKARIERMVEDRSNYETLAHAGGFEAGHEEGRQLGMLQERAMWGLAISTQEIENDS